MRIFIGLMEIAGYYSNLKQGFHKLGIEATFIDLEQHRFNYAGDDKINPLVKATVFFSKKRSKTPRKNLLQKTLWKAIESCFRVFLFIWAITQYDVFIMSGNVSFFFFYDLPILRFLNKKIIYIFNGSEARPPYIDGAVMGDNKGRNINQCISITKQRKAIIRKIEQYADIIISHPCYGHFHEKKYVHFNIIGFPYQTELKNSDSPSISSNRVRILHSPSDPEGKGSIYIRESITNLMQKGYLIDYIEISNKPHEEVLKELMKCDFVVDQVFSDLFLSAFGTEASFCAKPVVVSGYCLDKQSQQLPLDMIPPVQYCLPSHLENNIEKLILDVEYRVKLGQDAQEFIIKHWDPTSVAKRYLSLINRDIPETWLRNPADIRYTHGYGFAEPRVRKLVAELIKKGGVSSLQLGDKPYLENLFMKFAVNEQTLIQPVAQGDSE